MKEEKPPGARDPRLVGVSHRLVTHETAGSLEEAAHLRGMDPSAVIKTIVVRRSDDDYVFVLVPGDRLLDWPRLRAHLDQRRLSMPGGPEALAATGYEPGTITPLGASKDWPVLADERLASGTVSIGAGRPGYSITIDGTDLVDLLSAEITDVTKPANQS